MKKQGIYIFISIDKKTKHKRNKKRVVPDELNKIPLCPKDCFTKEMYDKFIEDLLYKTKKEDDTFTTNDYP